MNTYIYIYINNTFQKLKIHFLLYDIVADSQMLLRSLALSLQTEKKFNLQILPHSKKNLDRKELGNVFDREKKCDGFTIRNQNNHYKLSKRSLYRGSNQWTLIFGQTIFGLIIQNILFSNKLFCQGRMSDRFKKETSCVKRKKN